MGDRTPTTDQLRSAIDSESTGEKVNFPDPAAAPLGTDAEAAGEPPTATERQAEVRSRPRASGPEQDRGMLYYLGLVGMAYVLMLGVGVLALMTR
ncbi:hypothetical protein [Devosia nitrariae]|uniref:Uncharacterized protein n=1 Tax=Devosia nitrariae TaxID=2071872 RepID=A0ABQ5WAY5_9HYPH|nr:hypothetical protein [Devosia nitrariae]GLQ57257.1 hypothetical protein GCM10010862_45160 [Devosia nitrariae]